MAKELSEMSMEELWELFPIVLTEPSKEWATWYQDELALLNLMFHEIPITRISHIGSTAIHGICAKPIVDILIEVNTKNDMNAVKAILCKHGYPLMCEDETRMSFNKGYTKYGFAERVFHLHIRLTGDNDELYFRDYMNDQPRLAKEYEALKLSLWKQYKHDRDGYTLAKTDLIKGYTKQAKAAYPDRYE